MGKLLHKFICMVVAMVILLGCGEASMVEAASDKPYLSISSYSIEEGAVIPGQEITLKLVLKNTSRNRNIGNSMITMRVENDYLYPIYENSNQIYVNDLGAGAEKEVTVKLNAVRKIDREMIPVSFSMVYADDARVDNTNDVTLNLPVSTSGSLNIQNISVVDQAVIGTKARISATYENTGTDELSNIVLHVSGSGFPSGKEFRFENLGGGEKKYAEAYLGFNAAGVQKINVSFTYDDAEGITHETEIASYDIQVSYSENGKGVELINPNGTNASSLAVYLVLGGAIVILLIVIIVLYKKSKR